MSDVQKTPLFEEHVRAGAKMVPFAGWNMPVEYKGLREEHNNVRNNVGLFDVSHMGEIRFTGPKALETLDWITTNLVSKLKKGEAHYSLLQNDQGGLVDDIIVYCVEPNSNYLVCVNASNIEKDFAWMQKHNKGANITNESGAWAQIAVQGPKAPALIEKTLGIKATEMKPFKFVEGKFQGHSIIFATTGYTGEAGGEIFISAPGAVALWTALLKDGADFGVQPIGLGARDTLRTEMKYSLYGHEIDDTSNPIEAGLGWVIKAKDKDFLGKAKIMDPVAKGLRESLVGFKTLDKGIPRQGYTLVNEKGDQIGIVTSGTLSPSLDAPIGIGRVAASHAALGTQIWVDIRGRKIKAEVCSTPFWVRK